MGIAATTRVPMGVEVSVLSPNDHPNPSQGQQKGLFENQVPRNSRNNGNFGAFGLPMARATWHGPSGPYMGPYGCSSNRIVTK